MRMITGVKMMSKQTDTTLEARIIRGLFMSYLMGAKIITGVYSTVATVARASHMAGPSNWRHV